MTPSLADPDLQLTEDTRMVPAEVKRITHLGPPQTANTFMVPKKKQNKKTDGYFESVNFGLYFWQ